MTTISSTHIKFSPDGKTAWLILPPFDAEVELSEDDPASLDRPCDTCGGWGYTTAFGVGRIDCLACHGSRRHCFEITVDEVVSAFRWNPPADRWTFTVSVVEGMVLPIRKWGENYPVDHAHIEMWEHHAIRWLPNDRYRPDDPSSHEWVWEDVNGLPPEAAPPLTAVKLLVHKAPEAPCRDPLLVS